MKQAVNNPVNDPNLWDLIKELFMYPGEWLVGQLIQTDLGQYIGFSEADYDGAFSIIASIIISTSIIALAIYPIKAFIDTIIQCSSHELKKDRTKCKTGYVVLVLFLLLFVGEHYKLEQWLQELNLWVFAITWVLWFTQGKYWNK